MISRSEVWKAIIEFELEFPELIAFARLFTTFTSLSGEGVKQHDVPCIKGRIGRDGKFVVSSIGSFARPVSFMPGVDERLLASEEGTLARWGPSVGCASVILMCDTLAHKTDSFLMHWRWLEANRNWPENYFWPKVFRDDFDGTPEWLHLVKTGVLNLPPN